MSTVYESIEDAKRTAARLGGIDYDSAVFEEVPGLTVGSPFSDILLEDEECPKELKEKIIEVQKAQKAFKFLNKDGEEVKIVIGPFRHGFELWIVGPYGYAVRT